MTLEPLGARVLVRPLQSETTTKSGIILPDTAKEKPQEGIVEATGAEEAMTTGLRAGDKVLFAKYTGNEVRLNGTEYLLLEESDILARIRD